MGFTTTSCKFYNQFTGIGGGGVNFLNTNVGDKVTCVIEGNFFWSMELARLAFDSATKKISLANQFESRDFINQGFKIGDTITISSSISNDGNYTIIDITGRYITVSESLVDEIAEVGNVFGVTLITALDFYYNLIENSEQVNFVSKTDKSSVQRYSADGLNASISTPIYALIGTDSYGWVTDTLTGDISEVKIEGEGIVDFHQKFKITQTFFHAPIWSTDLLSNFINKKAPVDYTGGKNVKHVFQIDGKFDYNSPYIDHSGGSSSIPGRSAWFNQSSSGQRSEYVLTGIMYQDYDTDEVLPQLQVKAKTKVTIIVKSRSGKFVDSDTNFTITHCVAPLNAIEYTNTSTTMLENFRLDLKVISMGGAAVNGDKYGTDYQSLTNIVATFDSADQATITFTVDYSVATKAYYQQRTDNNRYYMFYLACAGESITTTRATDQVNVLCDFQSATFDYRDDSLLGLKDYFHGLPFPNDSINAIGNVAGFQGDYFFENIPFWVETASVGGVSPTLEKTTIQIVAVKSGQQDFILEEKKFATSLTRKLNSKQTVDIINDRGFILPEDSIYNRADMVRRADMDDGTKAYYSIRYGFVLRYETWRQVIQESLGITVDVFKDIQDVVQAWDRYSQGNGWALKLRVTWDVLGYDSFITTYQAETDIVVYDENTLPDEGPAFTTAIKYYDENNIELPGIQEIGTTRIVSKFIGDPSAYPSGYSDHYGYIFFDNNPAGGIFNRRFITSEFDSEDDSPFTTEDLPVNGSVSSYESKNLRFSIFSDRIELDTYFINDGEPNKPNPNTWFVSSRIGFTKQVGIGQQQIGRTFIVL